MQPIWQYTDNLLVGLDNSSNLLDIKDRAESTLQATNEWQKEQKQRDVIINKKITMQSEHIQ